MNISLAASENQMPKKPEIVPHLPQPEIKPDERRETTPKPVPEIQPIPLPEKEVVPQPEIHPQPNEQPDHE